MFKGDLGISFKYRRPVVDVISQNMWVSFAIALIATILQFLIAIPLGISSATHQYSVRDYLVTIFTMIGISFPTYFFGAIVIKLFSVTLGWFPSVGLVTGGVIYPATFAGWWAKLCDMAKHLVLPIFVSVFLSIGSLMRYTRTNMLEVLNADYIRTARAKGLKEKKVVLRYALKNAAPAILTAVGQSFGSLITGTIVTETLFNIPGLGMLTMGSINRRDVYVIQGVVLFVTLLYVLVNLVVDILYGFVDPRLQPGRNK